MSVPLCEVDIICKLCSDILKNPHQAGCCGKHFCKSCVDDRCSTSESATCPECNATEVTFFQDKHFERLMTLCGRSERPTNHSKPPHDSQERESSFSGDRVYNSTDSVMSVVERESVVGMRLLESEKVAGEDDVVECGQTEVSHVNVLSPPQMGQSTIKEKPFTDQNLQVFSHISSKLSKFSKEMSKRQNKVEQMLDAQEKILRTLYTKVEILEKRVSSHALLPYSVTILNIDSYIEGRVGDEWISPEFYTGTYSNKEYKLQLSVVPNSLNTHKKEKALSARLLIARGENDHKLNLHWLFILQVRFSDGPISVLGNILFWLVIADILYRAATKQDSEGSGNNGGEGGAEGTTTGAEDGRRRGWSLRRSGQSDSPKMVSLENAIMKRHTPREPGVSPPFEVICLWLADVVMFLDNTAVVLKHWSVNEPFMFCTAIGLPGLVLIFLGRYIPTLVLLYVLVMFLLTWPYIEHTNLRVKVVTLAQAHYPGILQKLKDTFKLLKKMALSRSRDESIEFSLSEGDDIRTAQALQEAFDQATGQQNQQQRQSEPGMSLLEDPALGLHTNDFQHSDMDSLVAGSLAPGPGEFPSISNMDQSLCLPSFPPQSQGTTMPSIGEELEDEDTSLALSTPGSNTDLDPLMDSIEVEFGYSYMDSGRRSNNTGQSTGSRQLRPGQRSTTNRASSQSSGRMGSAQTPRSRGGGGEGGFLPPPTYQSALDGSDGGITAAGGRDGYEWPIEDPPAPLGGGAGGKSRSTPLIREGMRRRGQRQQQAGQSAQIEENPLCS